MSLVRHELDRSPAHRLRVASARARRWCGLAALVTLAVLAPASAQGQAEPTLLSMGEFNIDLVSGPIVGSNRIVGLGGAYTALGYGADGAGWTPASYAVRTLWAHDWFDWDVTFDYSPGAFRNTDYDNDGRTGFAYDDYLFLTLGGRVQLGEAGFGGLVRMQDYRIGDGGSLQLLVANYGAGHAFLDGQLYLGIAARTAWLTIASRDSGTPLVDYDGTGPELGALLALEDEPYRIGFAARLAVLAEKNTSARVAAGLTVPERLVLPAEVQLGFAYQFGARPLNRRWTNPRDVERELRSSMLARRATRSREQLARENAAARALASTMGAAPSVLTEPRDPEFLAEEAHQRRLEEHELARALGALKQEREAAVRALSREYLLLSAEAIVIGQTDSAVGLESFLNQRRQTAGRSVSLGLRAGAESEPLENRLKVRIGTYLEPSRFAGMPHRVHATLAMDLRLFRWNAFGILDAFDLRAGGFVDVAPRYRNFGFGVGVWR